VRCAIDPECIVPYRIPYVTRPTRWQARPYSVT